MPRAAFILGWICGLVIGMLAGLAMAEEDPHFGQTEPAKVST